MSVQVKGRVETYQTGSGARADPRGTKSRRMLEGSFCLTYLSEVQPCSESPAGTEASMINRLKYMIWKLLPERLRSTEPCIVDEGDGKPLIFW